ncbi:MAG: glycosyltransferase family 4 protein [Actinobacteria bacterium]|nr:glycosyltransferase family 4 protein [Actinomycetota bacterium]
MTATLAPHRKRVAVFNLYWSTYGGGEQVAGAIADALADEHDVVLLGPEPIDIETTRARLGLDLARCGYQRVDDDISASMASAEYDVFINTTYRSAAENRAAAGLYYVHFPAPPPNRRQRVSRIVARSLAFVLPHSKSRRLQRVHVGLEKRAARTSWARTYTTFLANSQFTAGWVRRLWKVPSAILYPPVQPEVLPGLKTNTIAAVGRFFDPKFGHCKKQLDLAHAFHELEQRGTADWSLAMVGGADASSREYALAVRRAAQGHAMRVHFNAPRSLVHDTLAAAAIFWHGAGLGEDPDTHPDRFEHFGIAVVEAMAAGAVPVVFGAAGPAEIVRHGTDGFHWHTPAELVQLTLDLIADPALLATMSASAQQRAANFSAKSFREGLREAVAAATT